jgi:glycosyltransferase involved in cell wall biosynthesis
VASISSENDAAKSIAAAEAGFAVDPSRYRDFVEDVLSLAQDSELRQTLGRNARRFAEKNFAIGAIAGKFEKVFSTAAARARHT